MSAASQTKIFGLKLGVDPKIIVAGLLALALALFFLSNRTDNEAANASAGPAATSIPATAIAGLHRRAHPRRRTPTANRDTLRIEPVDAVNGDIDPTLRLDLLARLHDTPAATPGRSLFEIGAAAPTNDQIAKLNQHLPPKPINAQPTGPVQPTVVAEPPLEIPLKYYGFAKGVSKTSKRRGLFLEGDNVVVASEGDVVDHHFLVVSLTATQAQIEDTNMKRGKPIEVVPEAIDR